MWLYLSSLEQYHIPSFQGKHCFKPVVRNSVLESRAKQQKHLFLPFQDLCCVLPHLNFSFLEDAQGNPPAQRHHSQISLSGSTRVRKQSNQIIVSSSIHGGTTAWNSSWVQLIKLCCQRWHVDKCSQVSTCYRERGNKSSAFHWTRTVIAPKRTSLYFQRLSEPFIDLFRHLLLFPNCSFKKKKPHIGATHQNRGKLGVSFHPQTPKNQRFFLQILRANKVNKLL